MLKAGDRIKTKCSAGIFSHWVYGKVASVESIEGENVLYKIDWGEGCHDYLYNFEIRKA